MPTLCCPAVPPCTQELPTGCKRKLPHSPHQPWKSRSSLHQRESTPSGSVDQFWLHSPHSSKCGSPSKNTTSLAHPLSTESASKAVTCQEKKEETHASLLRLLFTLPSQKAIHICIYGFIVDPLHNTVCTPFSINNRTVIIFNNSWASFPLPS